ncbi:MAG: T9SS type A sorting domain-containing protein [Bacteroidales bacterium]|nr:T9SS type A sorting domain-containing protein [Bacteroidales bacterium]
MKKLLSFSILMVSVLFLSAQNYTLRQNTISNLSIEFSTPQLQSSVVKAGDTLYTSLTMDGYGNSTKVGFPSLPELTKLIEIPLCDEVNVHIMSAEYEEYDAAALNVLYPVMPRQQSYSKSYTGERPFNKDEVVYRTDAFYTSQPEVVTAHKIGTMRDVNLANLVVSPVAYNPVTEKIRLYSRIAVEISYENADIPATLEMKDKYYSPMFHTAKEAVINPMNLRNEFNITPIKYLIIANSMFANNAYLMSFVNWKKRIGYLVEVAYTNTIGTTTTAIKNYIQAEYTNATAENPAPTFVLFVGDIDQIPAFTGTQNHKTDLHYATWTDGDNLPDCYYGRFSAETVDQLLPQIEKTLMYEQYTMPDPSYLGKAVLIAGNDDTWAPTHLNGQINYIFDNYINTNSLTHNYTTVYKHLYDCSSQAATIRNEIGAGCGWVNYTAHGSGYGWNEPEFNCAHVASMSNAGKYGFMIGNCCLSCTCDTPECFAEAVLRVANKGAVGYIGGSDITYWDEDFYWSVGFRSTIDANPTYNANYLGAYDKLFHTHGETHDAWVTSIAGYMTAGNLAVEGSSSDLKLYYWEVYHLMGDPSLKPYMGIPSNLTVNSDDVLLVGSTNYEVQTVPYAYVALTYNNELVAAAFTDASGYANLTFSAIDITGDYELAVSAQNHIQFFKPVQVIAPTGPFVAVSSSSLSEQSVPQPGSTVYMNVDLTNYGVATASNVTTTLSSSYPGVVILQNSVSDISIAVDSTITHNNAFTIVLPDDAKDGDMIPFVITTTFGNETTTKYFTIMVVTPIFFIEDVTLQNANGTTSFAPGDMVNVTVTYSNIGHCPLTNAVLHLTSHYSLVTVNTPAQNITELIAGASATVQYQVSIGASIPDMTTVPLYVKGEVGHDLIVDTIYLTVGSVTETFETGGLTAFPWQTNNNPWFVTNEQPYAGNYCLRSSQDLDDDDQSEFFITINCSAAENISYFRKVSSEDGYDFFKFYIDDTEMDSQTGSTVWSQASFPVSQGTHTFKFSYRKDSGVIDGSDCAWVDNIVLPGMGTLCVEDMDDNVGVETREEILYSVFPNPTTGILHVQCSEPVQQIVIYDLSGRQLMSCNGQSEQLNTLNVNSLPSGLYFIRILTNGQHASISKFIKQ